MRNKGFTMVELIAVVAIIGVLSAIVLPAVFGQMRRSRVVRLMAEADDLRTASLSYFTEHGVWPYSNQIDGAINELLTQMIGGPLSPRGPYLDKAPRKRLPDNRYANIYAGLLMLDDVDDGKGDDSNPDRNGNQLFPDRFVYQGAVPVLDAMELDNTLDGELDSSTGSVVLYAGSDWTVSSSGASEILILIHEGF